MINKENIDDWLVRSIENDLSATEQKELDFFIETNPEFGEDLNAYNKTILTPDPSIVFSNKDILKKEEKPARPVFIPRPLFTISIAASLILLMAIGWWLRNGATIKQSPQVAKHSLPANKNKVQTPSANSYPGSSNPSTPSNADIPSLVKVNKKQRHIPTRQLKNNFIQPYINSQKENIASAVTYRTHDTLQYVEADDIMQIVFISNTNNRISPQEVTAMYNNMGRLWDNNSTSKGVKAIADMLDHSGNKNLAKAFEKASELTTRKYEISYNSSLLSFHKTFNSNQ